MVNPTIATVVVSPHNNVTQFRLQYYSANGVIADLVQAANYVGGSEGNAFEQDLEPLNALVPAADQGQPLSLLVRAKNAGGESAATSSDPQEISVVNPPNAPSSVVAS
jgi:hypothetical protein